MVWCVQHRDGWCATKSQPKNTPRYQDHVKTLCAYVVTLPFGFARRAPTCKDCLERLNKEDGHA